MSAYFISDVEVTKPEQYEAYKKLSTHAIEKFGAEILVRGGKVTPLEGKWEPKRMVVLRFKDTQTAEAFYNSEEYRRAREVRANAANFRGIIVEGV